MKSGPRATRAEIELRLVKIEQWLAERWTRPEIYAKALEEWDLQERQCRNLIARIQVRRQKELMARRPFEAEEIEATLERVIHRAFDSGDLAVARHAIVDLARFRGYSFSGDAPPPSSGATGQTVNINQILIDLRSLPPIERQRRLVELMAKRERLGLPTASAQQKAVDVPTSAEAEDADDAAEEVDEEEDDPVW